MNKLLPMFLVMLVMGVSCSSLRTQVVPVTPALIQDLGPDTLRQAAFYLSTPVEIHHRYYYLSDKIEINQGIIVNTDIDEHDVRVFNTRVKGAQASEFAIQFGGANYEVYGIEYEDGDDVQLFFAADISDPEGRFVLQWDRDDENGNHIVLYGGREYVVKYTGDERPYLKVTQARRVASVGRGRSVVPGKSFGEETND
ncbi:hypothetical protein FACS189483_10730 [Spirochaetia bacterium]|nr:hypothetical protein FACS189483_10730 [Spirochaetia bacterium]